MFELLPHVGRGGFYLLKDFLIFSFMPNKNVFCINASRRVVLQRYYNKGLRGATTFFYSHLHISCIANVHQINKIEHLLL